MHPDAHITIGTFVITSDNFLLLPPSPANFLDVSLDPHLAPAIDQKFDGQFVSILGHMGVRDRSSSGNVPSLIASRIVLQKDIERRAFEIFCAGNGQSSALSDWLRAEAELLGI